VYNPEMVYRQEFLNEQARVRALGMQHHQRVIDEKRMMTAVINEECPQFARFLENLELRGDLAAAADDLPAVVEGGCAVLKAEHATTDKFFSRFTVWSLRTRAFGVVGLAGAGESAVVGESWNEVSLCFKINREKRRIDTEFFAWNEEVAGLRNQMDDVEKFHIVWDCAASNDTPRLAYAGFGANQPYKQTHPHEARFQHRPRYRVFDRDSGQRYKYRVTWRELGPFDWNWTHIPMKEDSRGVTLRFVRLLDGSYLCLSDEEVVDAGVDQDWTQRRTECEAEGALSEVQSWEAVVEVPAAEDVLTSDSDPSLLDFVGDEARDYVAYFAAMNANRVAIKSAADIRKVARVLGLERASQYHANLERPCAEVYQSRFEQQLPPTMGDLFERQSFTSHELRTAVQAWTQKQATEVRRDLYYYGQDAISRMNRIRFAAWLAMQGRFGDVYGSALQLAFRSLNGGDGHGYISANIGSSAA
jgi:hypothetical protein